MRSWIEIDRGAFEHNVSFARKLVGPRIELGMVLKANAYGHGLREMALLVENNKNITWLLVSTIEEALLLRTWGCCKEILVMSYHDTTLVKDALLADIVMSITDASVAQTIAHAARTAGIQARVHLKIDMGMRRLGVMPYAARDLLHVYPELKIEGIFAHIGITNHPEEGVISVVVQEFHKLCAMLDPQKKLLHHIGASGLLWNPGLKDMVRVGTFLYGSWKSPVHRLRIREHLCDDLMPIMSWKTHIMQIKQVVAGDCVGYDQVFCATKPMRIAILPVGYADGYPRALSQKGVVWVEGCYAPVLGLVSMNLMAINISHIGSAREGSEVMLLGPHEYITPSALATRAGTNPNDITSRVDPHVIRRMVDYSALAVADEVCL